MFSEITLFKNNVSAILSPIVGSRAPRATRQQSNKGNKATGQTRATRATEQQGNKGNRVTRATRATG